MENPVRTWNSMLILGTQQGFDLASVLPQKNKAVLTGRNTTSQTLHTEPKKRNISLLWPYLSIKLHLICLNLDN